MMKITTLHKALIMFSVFLIFLSCKIDKEKVNPDLLFDLAKVSQDIVTLGDPLVLESSVTNEDASCADCSTKTAGENDRSIRVEYRAAEGEPWINAQLKDQNGDVTFELVKPVPEIKPGARFLESEGFIFSTPGFYRYSLSADHFFVIQERNESNNDAESDDGEIRASSNSKYKLMVEVVDPERIALPNYDTTVHVVIDYIN